ncbi:unnamed protein product [Amoebophrya sp. A25]|nr:unnamed protein product [Amoebophrya sp. A25]|eukprot:GSA25T00018100001.1
MGYLYKETRPLFPFISIGCASRNKNIFTTLVLPLVLLAGRGAVSSSSGSTRHKNPNAYSGRRGGARGPSTSTSSREEDPPASKCDPVFAHYREEALEYFERILPRKFYPPVEQHGLQYSIQLLPTKPGDDIQAGDEDEVALGKRKNVEDKLSREEEDEHHEDVERAAGGRREVAALNDAPARAGARTTEPQSEQAREEPSRGWIPEPDEHLLDPTKKPAVLPQLHYNYFHNVNSPRVRTPERLPAGILPSEAHALIGAIEQNHVDLLIESGTAFGVSTQLIATNAYVDHGEDEHGEEVADNLDDDAAVEDRGQAGDVESASKEQDQDQDQEGEQKEQLSEQHEKVRSFTLHTFELHDKCGRDRRCTHSSQHWNSTIRRVLRYAGEPNLASRLQEERERPYSTYLHKSGSHNPDLEDEQTRRRGLERFRGPGLLSLMAEQSIRPFSAMMHHKGLHAFKFDEVENRLGVLPRHATTGFLGGRGVLAVSGTTGEINPTPQALSPVAAAKRSGEGYVVDADACWQRTVSSSGGRGNDKEALFSCSWPTVEAHFPISTRPGAASRRKAESPNRSINEKQHASTTTLSTTRSKRHRTLRFTGGRSSKNFLRAIIQREPKKRIGLFLDGPKGQEAYQLGRELFEEFPNVIFFALHDTNRRVDNSTDTKHYRTKQPLTKTDWGNGNFTVDVRPELDLKDCWMRDDRGYCHRMSISTDVWFQTDRVESFDFWWLPSCERPFAIETFQSYYRDRFGHLDTEYLADLRQRWLEQSHLDVHPSERWSRDMGKDQRWKRIREIERGGHGLTLYIRRGASNYVVS